MDRTGSELLCGKVAEWFPLLPRARPPCRALPRRVDEIRELGRSASQGGNDTRISLAAEAHNKAALILSDCGLADLAQQLCWRQFDIFHAATPLRAKTAKLALQPIVNLGRPLTRSGHSKGIGKRMLDDSSTPEPWEQAVTACLRTFCLNVSGRPTGSSVTAMVNRYLQVDPKPGQSVFRTRLGLCVLDLAADPGEVGEYKIVAEVVREAVRSGDAYAARDVLSHTSCHASLSETDMLALVEVIDASGTHRGTMPVNLREDLMASVEIGEAELIRLLHQEVGTR